MDLVNDGPLLKVLLVALAYQTVRGFSKNLPEEVYSKICYNFNVELSPKVGFLFFIF